MADAVIRSRLGPLYHLVPHFKAWKAIREARGFVDSYVAQAMKVKSSLVGGRGESKEKQDGKYTFLNELAKHDEVDANRIRDETLNILLAGRDTTASLLSSLWFVLAREPEIWKTLQAEIDGLHGELPTYEKLRDLTYLKYCVQESTSFLRPFLTLK